MKTNTQSDILQFIEHHGLVSPYQLVQHFGISEQAIHWHLRRLKSEGIISRIGRAPKVVYRSKSQKANSTTIAL